MVFKLTVATVGKQCPFKTNELRRNKTLCDVTLLNCVMDRQFLLVNLAFYSQKKPKTDVYYFSVDFEV